MLLVWIEGHEYRLDENEVWRLPRKWTLDEGLKGWVASGTSTVLVAAPEEEQPSDPYLTLVEEYRG
jgi:hypothetical protein